jgi:hypothetical protein
MKRMLWLLGPTSKTAKLFMEKKSFGSAKSLTCLSIALQGCQMVCFKTKNPNLGKFWRALELKMFVDFMDT